jgi:hypothetical protein
MYRLVPTGTEALGGVGVLIDDDMHKMTATSIIDGG